MFLTPNAIMSDFDPETQLALAYTFPDASIKGYWFVYVDTILKYMRSIGMQWDKNRSNTSSALRMLMVLPLLPAEYMVPGLHSIRKWAREKDVFSKAFEQLCLYIEHDWLRSVGADKMSIFGLSQGVYNFVKHFNSDFRNTMNASQSSIWNLLGKHIHLKLSKKCIFEFNSLKNNFFSIFRMLNKYSNSNVHKMQQTTRYCKHKTKQESKSAGNDCEKCNTNVDSNTNSSAKPAAIFAIGQSLY